MNAQMTNAGGIASLMQPQGGPPAPAQAMQGQAQPLNPAQEITPKGGQQPAVITPDLAKLLQMQKFAEMQAAAQRNQMMQSQVPGGTIMEQLAAQVNPQPQMGMPPGAQQQPPVQAAHGGLMQLPSRLGQHYAGGGIVAFNGQSGSDVGSGTAFLGTPETPELDKSDLYAKAMAIARQDGREQPTDSDIKKALIFVSAPLAAAADVAVSPLKLAERAARFSFPTLAEGEPSSFTPAMDARNKYLSNLLGDSPPKAAPNEPATYKPVTAEGVRKHQVGNANKPALTPPPTPTAPSTRSSVSQGIAGSVAPPLARPTDLAPDVEDAIRKGLQLNPEDEAQKAVDRRNKLVDTEGYLKQLGLLKDDFDKKYNDTTTNRGMEGYAAWASGWGKGKPSEGIASAASASADAAAGMTDKWRTADLAHAATIRDLGTKLAEAKLSGNKELAAAAQKAYDEAKTLKKDYTNTGVHRIDTQDTNARHLQEMAMRMKEVHARATDAAAQRNDAKMQQLLATSYAQAEASANNETSAAAKQAASMAKDFDAGTYKQEAMARSLANNPVYQKVLKDLNIPAPTGSKTTGGGNVRLKFDAKGNLIN